MADCLLSKKCFNSMSPIALLPSALLNFKISTSFHLLLSLVFIVAQFFLILYFLEFDICVIIQVVILCKESDKAK